MSEVFEGERYEGECIIFVLQLVFPEPIQNRDHLPEKVSSFMSSECCIDN
jgi:hypothetical protein